MPKYRSKMRLARIEANVGDVDALTKYLVLRGYDDEIVAGGLESFVSSWEESVRWLMIETPEVLEEYEYSLFLRTQLYEVLEHASIDQITSYLERIQQADRAFLGKTIETTSPFELNTGDNFQKLDKSRHWWLFRIPKQGIY